MRRKPYDPNESPTLSPREREIVRLLAQGKGTKEIADALFISEKTVSTHRANIHCKLGLHSSVQVVCWALRNNLIQLTEVAA